MTEQQATVLMIKGTISELPPERQAVVSECEKAIRSLLSQHPNGEAMIALALVGAMFDAES